MAKLIFFAITSLDGFVEDPAGRIDWGAPDDEASSFTNELERSIGTNLYGRRMYETMRYWETVELSDGDASERDFAAHWQAADKVVYSRSLAAVTSPRTRLERTFDPGRGPRDEGRRATRPRGGRA